MANNETARGLLPDDFNPETDNPFEDNEDYMGTPPDDMEVIPCEPEEESIEQEEPSE